MKRQIGVPRWIATFLCLTALFTCATAQEQSSGANRRSKTVRGKLTQESSSVQIGHLQSQDPQVVVAACSSLAESRSKAAAPAVLAVLQQSENPLVQSSCAFAAGRIAPPDAASILQKLALDKTRAVTVRVAAVRAASLLTNVDHAFLIDLLNDPEDSVQAQAAYVLCQLQVEAAIPGLKKMLASGKQSAKNYALTAVSIWPEAFSPELVSAAVKPDNPQPNRLLALTALDSSPSPSLTRPALNEVANSITPSSSSELTQGVAQLLGETEQGREVAADRKIDLLTQAGDNRPIEFARLDYPANSLNASAPSLLPDRKQSVRPFAALGVALAALLILLLDLFRPKQDSVTSTTSLWIDTLANDVALFLAEAHYLRRLPPDRPMEDGHHVIDFERASIRISLALDREVKWQERLLDAKRKVEHTLYFAQEAHLEQQRTLVAAEEMEDAASTLISLERTRLRIRARQAERISVSLRSAALLILFVSLLLAAWQSF